MAQKYKSIWVSLQVDTAVREVSNKIDKSDIEIANRAAWQSPPIKGASL